MSKDWVKYCSIFVDGKFNQRVVCCACENVFMEMRAYWQHVDEKHWNHTDSTERHTDPHSDFKKAAKVLKNNEPSKLPAKDAIIDLTESDDECESRPVSIAKDFFKKRN